MKKDERENCLSASGVEAAALCPGKLKAEEGIPDETSEAAEVGTRIHAKLAGEKIELTSAEMETANELAWKRIRLVREMFEVEPRRKIIEKRMWYTVYGLRMSGKPDYICIKGERALIVDYKTGWSDIPRAIENPQLAALAVLLRQNVKTVKSITVAILHPTRNNSLAEFDMDNLATARNEITRVMRAAYAKNPQRIPGEIQCRYCKARTTCPEVFTQTMGLVKTGKLDLMEASRMSDMLEAASVASKLVKDIQQAATEMLQKMPDAIPGWRLKPGNKRRDIPEPEEAFAALSDVMGPSEFAAACTVRLGELERRFQAATKEKTLKAAKENLNQRLNGIIIEKEGQPRLAKEPYGE